MDYRDKIISVIAEKECSRISRKTIRSLCIMKEGMQSGDDTPLRSVWDEVCVQVQGEESVMWDAYLDTMHGIILLNVAELDPFMKQVIWLQTDNGWGWEPESESQEAIPFDDDAIADYILHEYVLLSASGWTNNRIEKYIYREK